MIDLSRCAFLCPLASSVMFDLVIPWGCGSRRRRLSSGEWRELGGGRGFRAISLKDWSIESTGTHWASTTYWAPFWALADAAENRMDTAPALMVYGVFRYSRPKEGKWRKMEEILSCVSGLFSFVHLLNSSSIYWPLTMGRFFARQLGYRHLQPPPLALEELQGGAEIPGHYVWALAEAGLEKEDANPAGEGPERFLERAEGVGLHLKGWMRVCQVAQRDQEIPGRRKGSHKSGEEAQVEDLDGGGLMVESLDGKSGSNLNLRYDRGHSQVQGVTQRHLHMRPVTSVCLFRTTSLNRECLLTN